MLKDLYFDYETHSLVVVPTEGDTLYNHCAYEFLQTTVAFKLTEEQQRELDNWCYFNIK